VTLLPPFEVIPYSIDSFVDVLARKASFSADSFKSGIRGIENISSDGGNSAIDGPVLMIADWPLGTRRSNYFVLVAAVMS
jgi:hypothetical protein